MRALLKAKSLDSEYEQEFELMRDLVILGRSPQCDLSIGRKTVSKRHAKFIRNGESYEVEDLNSSGGVYVNSEKVMRKKLGDGDKIIIGDVILLYQEDRNHVVSDANATRLMPQLDQIPDATPMMPMGRPAANPYETIQLNTDQLPGAAVTQAAPVQPAAAEAPENDELGVSSSPFASRSKKKKEAPQDLYTRLRAEVHEQLVKRPELRRDTFENVPDDEIWLKVKTAANQIIYQMNTEGRIPRHIKPMMLLRDVLNDALGLGPIQEFIDDAGIEEIMVNGPDNIFIAKHGKTVKTDKRFIDEEKLLTAINRIVAPLGRQVNQARPMVDARLADGSRINAVIPPVSLIGPVLTIRKFPAKPLQPEDLVKKGSMSPGIVEFLRFAVKHHQNILVAGGTAAGKTTLLNVMSSFIPPDERIITIEDSAELQLQQPHVISLETKPRSSEGAMEISIRELVKNALRMRPDRIIVGECRGAEAVDMLQAMNTGHDGSMTTGHANSAKDMLTRLETMVMMAGLEIPLYAIREQVARAIDIVVFVERFPDGGRRISEIIEVSGMDDDRYETHEIFRYNYQIHNDGKLTGSFDPKGYIPQFMREIKERGGDIPLEIFTPSSIV